MDKTLDKIIKKHIVLTALTGVAIVLLMITITYGLYQINHENTQDQEISLGDFDVDLTSSSGQITLSNINPGVENNTTYSFTTSNSGDYVVKYSVYFTDNTTTFLADSTNASTYSSYTQITSQNYQYIEYKLDNGDYKPLSDVYNSTTGRFTIITGRLQPGISYTHTVKFRVSSNAPNDIQGSILALNITMEAAASKETGVDKILKLVQGSPTNSTDVITKEAPSGANCTNTLAYDGTVDNNLRYVGANPCNYVTFNGETAGWRIVGIMNNVDDGTGVTETRIKLIRATSLGNYSWDTSESSVNSGYGVNDWTQADLKNELNGDYLNTTLNANTNWYNGRNNAQTGVFDYTKRLNASAQDLIDNAKWYLGGFATQEDRITTTMYTKERGTTVWGSTSGQTCNDGACPRATEWTGKVALIYPSDYGYATAGGTTTARSVCIGSLSTYGSSTSSGETWLNSSYSDCKNNDWLKPSSGYNWLLAPYSNNAYSAFYVLSSGYVTSLNTYGNNAVLPAVYLQSGVTISGGNGTESEPYVLA